MRDETGGKAQAKHREGFLSCSWHGLACAGFPGSILVVQRLGSAGKSRRLRQPRASTSLIFAISDHWQLWLHLSLTPDSQSLSKVHIPSGLLHSRLYLAGVSSPLPSGLSCTSTSSRTRTPQRLPCASFSESFP